MVENKYKNRILNKYVWFVSVLCIVWFLYSCAALFSNRYFSERIPDHSYRIVEVNPGNVDVSATITISYAGQNYSVPITEDDLNHHRLHKKFFHNRCFNYVFYEGDGNGLWRLGIVGLGIMFILLLLYLRKHGE
jgi:hypothetical protein